VLITKLSRNTFKPYSGKYSNNSIHSIINEKIYNICVNLIYSLLLSPITRVKYSFNGMYSFSIFLKYIIFVDCSSIMYPVIIFLAGNKYLCNNVCILFFILVFGASPGLGLLVSL